MVAPISAPVAVCSNAVGIGGSLPYTGLELWLPLLIALSALVVGSSMAVGARRRTG